MVTRTCAYLAVCRHNVKHTLSIYFNCLLQGKVVWGPLPIIIFGTSAVVAGALSLFLPETLHQGLPETMEDGEQFGKDQNLSIL